MSLVERLARALAAMEYGARPGAEGLVDRHWPEFRRAAAARLAALGGADPRLAWPPRAGE